MELGVKVLLAACSSVFFGAIPAIITRPCEIYGVKELAIIRWTWAINFIEIFTFPGEMLNEYREIVVSEHFSFIFWLVDSGEAAEN